MARWRARGPGAPAHPAAGLNGVLAAGALRLLRLSLFAWPWRDALRSAEHANQRVGRVRPIRARQRRRLYAPPGPARVRHRRGPGDGARLLAAGFGTGTSGSADPS